MCQFYSVRLIFIACLCCTLLSIACYFIKMHDGIMDEERKMKQLLNNKPENSVTSLHVFMHTPMLTNAPAVNTTFHGEKEKCQTVNKIVDDGMYWSREVEALIPKGLGEHQIKAYFQALATGTITKADNAEKHLCSRTSPFNKYVELDNGIAMCARVKKNSFRHIAGEILSFHLSQILHLDNIPPSRISVYRNDSALWSNFPKLNLWQPGDIVSLTQWIYNLSSVLKIHDEVHKRLQYRQSPLTLNSIALQDLCDLELVELAQMSDLIIFDLITGQTDRFATHNTNMQMATEVQDPTGNTNQNVTSYKIRNTGMTKDTHKVWIHDNERSMFFPTDPLNEAFLKTLCIYRKSTLQAVEMLANSSNATAVLLEKVKKDDPIFWDIFHQYNDHLEDFSDNFIGNIQTVIGWIKFCKKLVLFEV